MDNLRFGEMLAQATRAVDLEGSPRVRIEAPAEFFARAEAEHESPSVWVGELYLEAHRGTFTSQAKTKAGNRRCEHLLREAELWATTATVRGLGAFAPADAPTIAIAVAIEGGGYGASTAAPIARKVFDAWLLGKKPIPPVPEAGVVSAATAPPDFSNVRGSPDAQPPAPEEPAR